MNRQTFRTFYLFQLTDILPALSATLFGVWLRLLLISFLCFFWGEENGSTYEASCCGVRGSFVEDAVIAEFFLLT